MPLTNIDFSKAKTPDDALKAITMVLGVPQPFDQMNDTNMEIVASLGCALAIHLSVFMDLNNDGQFLPGYFKEFTEALEESCKEHIQKVAQARIDNGATH